jgi:aminoglycoside phosphotransferase (APT) family kinase protein
VGIERALDERTRAWVEDVAGPVAAVRPLLGATSAEIDALEVDGNKLVLKRYVNREWLEREPDLAAREAVALRVLRGASVPVPELVGVDPDGSVTGAPSVLMTRLRGRHRWDPPSIERLADVAVGLHDVEAPADFRRYRRYVGPGVPPPTWTSRPALWERAIAVADAAVPDDVGFIHRDHHAGNVLWWRGRVSGVVDFVEACVGPRAVDSARVRPNLVAPCGVEAARRYAACPGIETDPVWDIVDAVDCMWGHGPDPADRDTVEEFVARALADLG